MIVSGDSEEALVFYCNVLAEPNAGFRTLRLQGHDVDAEYQVDQGDRIYGGDELIYAGLRLPVRLNGDFRSMVWRLRKMK